MASSDVSFKCDLFKTYRSFKWKNAIDVGSKNSDTFSEEEQIEMTFYVKAKSMDTFGAIEYYWMNEKTVAKYPNLCATVEPILLAFSSIK